MKLRSNDFEMLHLQKQKLYTDNHIQPLFNFA